MHFLSTLTITATLLSIVPSILGAPIPAFRGTTIGEPCFGSATIGCTPKQSHKQEEEIVAREPEPVAKPEFVGGRRSFTIGKSCFGSTATGCTLKLGHKPEEEIASPATGPITEPRAFTIGKPCLGSTATGCALKQGHRPEAVDVTFAPVLED